jgi:hypothetical protein
LSSPRYATPLRLRVEHSARLRAIFTLFYLPSSGSLLLAQLPTELKLLALVGVSVAFLHTWRRRPELGAEAVELILRPNGKWQLNRGSKSIALQLHGQSTISHRVMLLCFHAEEGRGRFDYLLWHSEQPADLYRRLLVYLKLYAAEAVQG